MPVAVASSLDQLIGNTPLVRLTSLEEEAPGVEIYAKAEFFNPGGSVKDRPALNMIREGERSGALRLGKIILDATSGNTGIAYAMIGAARGYAVKLCLPLNASPERKKILRAYGADLVLTNPAEQSDGAIRMVKQLYAEDPDLYFYPDQYGNDANWRAHYESTGPEIWAQTEGRVTHFVAGLGTTGTMMGVGRFLRDTNPNVTLISMQPDSPFNGLEGLKHLETAIVPPIYDPRVADQNVECRTEDAYAMVKRLARCEGLLVGISAGGNVHTTLTLAKRAPQGSVFVTILCDGADRYLSERFWEDTPDEPRPQV
ncbi:cysteine synthase [Capsulimonas corticalis]|uniref:Cysteine synthase n=1 Tax=Capsulimonas corticalis TaxID=2219043 RepID=A0A402CS24_9BACT|nr:cysteine synthase family protein [Capsulimonas corticalis]BDI28156.1 cysteine synthase [Capsulimonas corticalis]